jgi:hypothetical protein
METGAEHRAQGVDCFGPNAAVTFRKGIRSQQHRRARPGSGSHLPIPQA